jgi:hypothetical protein
MTSGYRDPTDRLSSANPRSAHIQGRAFDVRAQTPEQADTAIGKIRELLNPRGLVEGRDYVINDEVRHPAGWATGPHVHTQFTEEGMQRYQDRVYQDPFPDANPPRPPADIPYPDGVPLPTARPDAAGPRPAEAQTPPLPAESPATDIYPGANAPRPPAEVPDPRVSSGGFNAIDAAAKPSGVEKAQTFLNRSVESILKQYSPENLSAAGWALDIKQPLREALKGPLGSQILSGLQPRLGDVGLTRSDFTKAVADPRARFGGDFGSTGGDELPTPGSFTPYPGFRQSSNFEDRSTEQLGRDQLAELQARGTSQELLPEVPGAPPLGSDPMPNLIGRGVDTSNIQRLLGYTPQQWPDEAYPQQPAGKASPTSDAFQSPGNDYNTFQQQSFLSPWQASIPAGRNSPEVVDAVKALAARLGTEPAAIAAMIQQETHDNPASLWNPQITPNRYGYRGMTQMGPETFTDAARMGTSIGGFPTIEDYQRGTAAQQIAAYGDWLDLYTRQNPQGAAAFVNSGALARLSPGEAAAILQGTQFSPNAARWVRALEQGDMNVPTTATRQAEELRPYTVNSMTDVAREHMAAWPQQRIWSDYNMPPRQGGY